jgi:hypothetical protein
MALNIRERIQQAQRAINTAVAISIFSIIVAIAALAIAIGGRFGA